MADVYWEGKALPISQVDDITIGVFDLTTTYTVTINAIDVSVLGVTDPSGTAAALQAALELSTQPYFSAIDWTVVTNVVTATSGDTGMPFTLSTSVVDGTGTISDATITDAESPHHWDVADNWSTNTVPVSTDSVILENSDIDIRWGLDQNAVALTSLIIRKSFTASLGLRRNAVAVSVAGGQTDPSGTEYRDLYLIIGATTLDIGQNISPTGQTGSPMTKIDVRGVSTITMFDSAGTPEERSEAVVQLLTNSSSTTLNVINCPGSIGIASGSPFETSTIGSVFVGDTVTGGGVFFGCGATISTEFQQASGNNFIDSAATIPLVDVKGGVLTTSGVWAITTMRVDNAGLVNLDNNAVTTLTIDDGEVTTLGSSIIRTIGTLQVNVGGTFRADPDITTVTTLLQPNGEFTLTAE